MNVVRPSQELPRETCGEEEREEGASRRVAELRGLRGGAEEGREEPRGASSRVECCG